MKNKDEVIRLFTKAKRKLNNHKRDPRLVLKINELLKEIDKK